MQRFRFCDPEGRDVTSSEWLRVWSARYPTENYDGYDELIAAHRRFTPADIEQIGRWKDAAKSDGRWKRNVASVAYPIWMQAAKDPPRCPRDNRVADFLNDWSERSYTNRYASGSVTKRFGLSRATTLLHFLSGGRFPIFDSRVRAALKRLLGAPVRNSVEWYLDSCCPLFAEIAAACGTNDFRLVDKALFSYGGRTATPSGER